MKAWALTRVWLEITLKIYICLSEQWFRNLPSNHTTYNSIGIDKSVVRDYGEDIPGYQQQQFRNPPINHSSYESNGIDKIVVRDYSEDIYLVITAIVQKSP